MKSVKDYKVLEKDLREILFYIQNKWNDFTVESPKGALKRGKDLFDVLYLPNPYIVPNNERFDVMFYWDNYFIIQGLKLHDDKKELIKGIIDNYLYEIENFGMVLNGNKKKWSDRSQIPYLTSMIREVYSVYKDKKWLKRAFMMAKKEYRNYWMNKYHKFDNGLSRFYSQSPADKNYTREYKSRAESSWDMSPRFDDEDIHDLIPVDLNMNLYKYEKDFEFFDKVLYPNKKNNWGKIAQKRKKIINRLCWDNNDGLFYDYNFKLKKKKKVRSLAGYNSLLYGFATKGQSEKLVNSLKYFKTSHGYAACDRDYGFKDRQWSWPYIWAPLVFILYEGLYKYGYATRAKKIAKEFISLVILNYKKTGYIWEKYNGDDGTPADVYDRYRNQKGFSWTNAVFEYLVHNINILRRK